MEAGSEGAECRARGRDAESELPLFSYMLRITYDGTDFLGWQMQAGSGKATVQETLEKALCTTLQTPREVLKLQVTLLAFMCGVFCRVMLCARCYQDVFLRAWLRDQRGSVYLSRSGSKAGESSTDEHMRCRDCAGL